MTLIGFGNPHVPHKILNWNSIANSYQIKFWLSIYKMTADNGNSKYVISFAVDMTR